MEFTDREVELAKTIAYKMASKWSLMDKEELHARLNYWLVMKYNTVVRYRSEEGGEGKLYVALNREAAKQSQHETEILTGEPMHMKENQITKYSYEYQTIFNALSHLWTWRDAILEDKESDGKLADIMLDIEKAYAKLNPSEQILLEYKFKDDKTYNEIALELNISKQGARMKIVRLVDHIKKLIG